MPTLSRFLLDGVTIGRVRLDGGTAYGAGVKIEGTGKGNAWEIKSGNDPYIRIKNVFCVGLSGTGFWMLGTDGGARGAVLSECIAWMCGATNNTTGTPGTAGFILDGSSDAMLQNCRASTCYVGVVLGGGSAKASDSKAAYCVTDGWQLTSSRVSVHACEAQDNGRWGFRSTSSYGELGGCRADSNQRLDSSGGGVYWASNGKLDFIAMDRNRTPSSRQVTGIQWSGTPTVEVSGFVAVPSGTSHVVGSVSSSSLGGIVREGTTPWTA